MHNSTWRHGCVTAGYLVSAFHTRLLLILDKIWPSPKHVWNEIILSWFFGSPLSRPLARSLARASVRPPFVSGRRDYCLRVYVCVCVWRRAEDDRTSRFRQLQFRFHFLRFAVFKAFKVLLLLSDSIFSKVCMFLDIVRRRFSFMCWLVFFRQRCVCRRGLLSDRFRFLGVAVFQDLKDLLVDSDFSYNECLFLDNNARRQFKFCVLNSFQGKICVAEMLQRFCVRPLPFSRIRSLQRFEKSFIWFDLRRQFSFVCWILFRQRCVAEVL
jgi:hypothetical protein